MVEYLYDSQNLSIHKPFHSDGEGHLDGRRIFIYAGNPRVMDFRRGNSQDIEIGQLPRRYLWGPGRGSGLSRGSRWRRPAETLSQFTLGEPSGADFVSGILCTVDRVELRERRG